MNIQNKATSNVIVIILIFLSLLGLFVGCKEKRTVYKPPPPPTQSLGSGPEFSSQPIKDYIVKEPNGGYFENGTYINDFLGFSMEFPNNWTIVGDDGIEKQIIIEGSAQLSSGNNNDKRDFVELVNETVLFLFLCSKYPAATPNVLNCNISVICENTSQYGNLTIDEYISGMKESMNSDNWYTFKDLASRNINGTIFKAFSAHTDIFGFDVYQRAYLKKLDGYILTFNLTYSDNESLSELDEILNTANLN